MNLVINKCVTAVKVSNFFGHYLRNRSTLDIGILGYIGIVWHKEHSPEVLSIPPGTPCILWSEGRDGCAAFCTSCYIYIGLMNGGNYWYRVPFRHTVCLCSVCTAITFLNCIHQFIFVMVYECVFCELATGSSPFLRLYAFWMEQRS